MDLKDIGFEISGRILKIISIRDDWILPTFDPREVLFEIENRKIKADILSFVQSLFDREPKYSYYMEWENVAALRLSNFDEWFNKTIKKTVRNRIRKADKEGIEVCIKPFNDDLVLEFMEIFNESRFRQGRPYPYYGQEFNIIRKGWIKDLDRSEFIVAYHNREIVGFIKLVYGDRCARTTGTVCKLSYRNKSPMNALLATAVERACLKNCNYLVYGRFTYGQKDEDSLVQFKKQNGFEKIEIPRYFIPLSCLGKIAIRLRLYRGLRGLLPQRLILLLIRCRSVYYSALSKIYKY